MTRPAIRIGNRFIGSDYPAYIIAEMSANHHQDFNQAVKTIEAAKKSGADAIKLQTYTPDSLTIDCDNDFFNIKGTSWDGRTLYDLYREAHMPWEWQPRLKAVAERLGIDFFSSAFDASAVDFLEEMGVQIHKIASFEIVDIPLIRRIASTGKALVMSTGMATLGEIEEAVQAARNAGADQIALLKCTSAYPALPEQINLRTIPNLIETFKLPVGVSDHTMGAWVPVTAVAIGACIVEKHFTLSRNYTGPDSTFSMEPLEFKEMVAAIRTAEKVLGRVSYGPKDQEKESLVFRRSLFVVRDMKAGEEFNESNVRSIRPGYGLAPKFLDLLIGLRANRDLKKGTPMDWRFIEGE